MDKKWQNSGQWNCPGFLEEYWLDQQVLHLLGLSYTLSMMTKNFMWSFKTMDKACPKKLVKQSPAWYKEHNFLHFLDPVLWQAFLTASKIETLQV